MKQQTVFEMNIPDNATPLPALKPDGTYELMWRLPSGSYCRLIFESGDLIHETYGKVVGLETAQRQAKAQPVSAE